VLSDVGGQLQRLESGPHLNMSFGAEGIDLATASWKTFQRYFFLRGTFVPVPVFFIA
jgi:hypothetical protein